MKLRLLLSVVFATFCLFSRAQNVGVGTTDPQSKLHVAGDLRTEGPIIIEPTTKAAASTIGITNEDGLVIITSTSGTQANAISLTGTPDDGQLLYLINNDNDAASFSGFSVPPGDYITLIYNGSAWIDLGVITGTPATMADADGDTKIQLEESSDEDLIRIDLEGVERWVFIEDRLEPGDPKDNTFIGIASGANLTSGEANTAYGSLALSNNTSGEYNTALGAFALTQTTTGSDNVGVGDGALSENTSGGQNTAIGSEAMLENYEGEYNTAIGILALESADADSNIAVGAFSLSNITTGEGNIGIGVNAGHKLTTGSNNVYIGNAGGGMFGNGNNKLVIGNHVGNLIYGDFDNHYLLFNSEVEIEDDLDVHGDGQVDGDMIIHGELGFYNSYAFPTTKGTSGQVLTTDGSGGTSWAAPNSGTDNQTVDVFSLSGTTLSLSVEDDGEATKTVDLSGIDTDTDEQTIDVFSISGTTLSLSVEGDGEATKTVDLSGIDTDTDNQTVDVFSLSGSTLSLSLEDDGNSDYTVDLSSLDATKTAIADADGDTKIQVEESADEDIIRFDIGGTEMWRMTEDRLVPIKTPSLTLIGQNAGAAITSGTDNHFIGKNSGSSTTTGSYNVGVGSGILLDNTTGGQNVAVGHQSLYNNTTGDDNTAIGFQTLAFSTASSNSAFGYKALYSNTTGANNLGLGKASLRSNTTGDENVCLGAGSGFSNTTGDLNVFLGYTAGYYETGSEKLYIDNSATSSPLIYGEFDNNLIRINGTLDINDEYTLPTVDGTSGQILTTNGSGTASWSAATVNTDNQAIDVFSLSGSTLSLSVEDDGEATKTVDLSGIDTDTDEQTIDVFSLSGTTLSLSVEDDGEATKTVDLSGIDTDTDEQTIDVFSLSGTTLSLSVEDDGEATKTVDLSGIDTDTDEQTIDVFSLSGTTLSLSVEDDGEATKTVDLSSINATKTLIADGDADTKIQLEESSDEDAIRIDIAGTERWVFTEDRLEPIGNQYNTFIGKNSGSSINTAAQYNTAVGGLALVSNTWGDHNNAFGYNTLNDNTTGRYNSGFGSWTLQHNTIGEFNMALGYRALEDNTEGDYNVGIGSYAISNSTTAEFNVAVGSKALLRLTTADGNVAIGHNSLETTTTGAGNTAMGYQSGYSNSTGGKNVFIGYQAGYSETGSNTLYIDNSNTSSPLIYGEFDNDLLEINGDLMPGSDNTRDLGGSSNRWTALYATNGTIQTSDVRFKTNIEEMGYGLDDLMKLRSVTYNWKTDSLGENKLGFIAQELEKVIPEVVTVGTDSMQTRGVNYAELVPVLVKAIQEQQLVIEAQNSENSKQEVRLSTLEAKLDLLLNATTATK